MVSIVAVLAAAVVAVAAFGGPWGQRGSSTTPGNGGNQPGTTSAPGVGPATADPQADQHAWDPACEMAADQRKRWQASYFRSWRAITMRWIWFVPS